MDKIPYKTVLAKSPALRSSIGVIHCHQLSRHPNHYIAKVDYSGSIGWIIATERVIYRGIFTDWQQAFTYYRNRLNPKRGV